MQALLADRFQMVLHHKDRERRVLALDVGPNLPKFMPTAGTRVGTLKVVDGNLLFEHFTPAELADRLSVMLGRPVLDRTGVRGAFDVMITPTGGVAGLKANRNVQISPMRGGILFVCGCTSQGRAQTASHGAPY